MSSIKIEHGVITRVVDPRRPTGASASRASSVPGLPNLHSHAFQRAMAGLTERRGSESRFFLDLARADVSLRRAADARTTSRRSPPSPTWRCSRRASPGWPSSTICTTSPTAGPTTTSPRCRSASSPPPTQVGIGLTLLPVLYRQSGFGGKPPSAAQRRFLNDRDSYARIMETKVPGGRIGIAPHSLRAVTLDDLEWAAAHLARPAGAHPCQRADARGRGLPRRARPPADRPADGHRRGRRALVPRPCHARRRRRTRAHGKAKAVVGLCPITEANLGDGLFDVPDFLAQGGRFGVGSDSNVRISAADELRTLEYGQRLIHRQRNVLGDATRSTGRRLFEAALAGGAQAMSRCRSAGQRRRARRFRRARGRITRPCRGTTPARSLAVRGRQLRRSSRSIAGACRWCRTAAMSPARS